MSNDIEIQAPAAILMYKRRWRIEVWFKAGNRGQNLSPLLLEYTNRFGSLFPADSMFNFR